MKGNVIRLNIMHLNSVHLNSIGEVQSVSLKAGESTEDPVYPPTTYTLAANVSNGKVTATKNGTAISLPYVATEGDVIVLSVTPDEGYEFNGWLDGNKSNPRTVTMTGNVVLSASCVEIAKPTYTLSASVTNGKVSATKNGSAVNLPFTANEGDTIVVEVTPNDGYSFEGWNDGNTDNPRSITMASDVVLSAQCVEVVQPPVGNYIQFEDPAVEAICVANWSSDGIGLTEEDAAAVTDIRQVFRNNSTITTFNELEYFTGLKSLGATTGGNTYAPFYKCTSLRSVRIPKSVTLIGNSSFEGCSVLKDVGSLEYVTTIQGGAFANTLIGEGQALCTPNLTGQIGNIAFQATQYDSIDNLGTITEIAAGTSYLSGAFAKMTKLKKVRIPATVMTIGRNAFAGCSGLEQVICEATTPPTAASDMFLSTNSDFLIYVPDASLEAYKTATNWKTYADRIHPLSEIEGDNGVIKYDGLVGAYTFKGRSNEDADYDLVQDRSGNGNVMSIDMVFGREDNVTGEVAGYCDYGIFMYRGFGKTTIPQLAESNTISIIAKRVLFTFEGVGEYSAFFGATENPYSNAVWFEYAEGGSFQSRNTKGEYMGRAETEIVWMTPTYMNGHRLTPTSERTMDGTCYLGRIRTTVNPTERTKVECLYIFNRELSPSEVESFIKEHIDADYVLPTIEQ